MALEILVFPTCAEGQSVYYHPNSTRKVAQLTGDLDRPLNLPTTSLTDTKTELYATDLGSTFEHNGKLVFLFGDTWGGHDGLLDTMAFSESTDPWNLEIQVPELGGLWRPIMPPGLKLAEFCVPSHGISVNGNMYSVFTQDALDGSLMGRSFMIESTDDGATWNTLYQLDNHTASNPRFVNVWLEEKDGFIYMFGSGAYRTSSPTLARAPKALFPQKSAWEYFRFINLITGQPVWSSSVAHAGSLFTHNQIGEFSCSYIPQLQHWVMLYNSGSPRGITMRTAPYPYGPWSAGQVIMEPSRDQAYGHYMHISHEVEKRDLFSDFGRENEWGGEYGPYLIPRFTQGDAQRCELFYTMSTWNPYQVVLMRSTVSNVPPPPPPATVNQTLSHNLWHRYPSNVADEFDRDGVICLTTYTTAEGDDNTGWLWQPLPPGTQSLSFSLHGGHAEMLLLENATPLPASGNVSDVAASIKRGDYGRVVMRATGVNDNTDDIAWEWKLAHLDPTSLAIVILDNTSSPWGFLSFTEIEAKVAPPGSAVADWDIY